MRGPCACPQWGYVIRQGLLAEQEPEATAIHQEALHSLSTFLTTLSADKRELLALRFATGLTSTQIAALVGKKPEAVKKQITRLLQSLKEHYHYEHP